MPLKQLATIRYQALDRCFSDRTRYYYIEDLVAAVNQDLENNGQPPISKRSVQYAINQMEGNPQWEVIFEEPALINGRRYYRYDDSSYSIWRRDLDERQLSQLKMILLKLQQFKGLPELDPVYEMIRQLSEHYHFTLPEPKEIMAFDTNENVEGIDYIAPIFEAIVGNKALKVQYSPYGKEPYEVILHPYYIKEYNNRWFALGVTNKKTDKITNLALDRIQSIEATTEPYIPNTDYNFEDYFEDIIGVTKNKRDEALKIELRFSEKRLPYVLSKPIHDCQSNARKDEGIIVLKQIIPNKELYQRLLSYGADVEVLSPDCVRQKMAEEAQKMVNMYNK